MLLLELKFCIQRLKEMRLGIYNVGNDKFQMKTFTLKVITDKGGLASAIFVFILYMSFIFLVLFHKILHFLEKVHFAWKWNVTLTMYIDSRFLAPGKKGITKLGLTKCYLLWGQREMQWKSTSKHPTRPVLMRSSFSLWMMDMSSGLWAMTLRTPPQKCLGTRTGYPAVDMPWDVLGLRYNRALLPDVVSPSACLHFLSPYAFSVHMALAYQGPQSTFKSLFHLWYPLPIS